jgi:hypothetical protein
VDDLGDDLSGGVSGSYAIVSIKGGRFSLKYNSSLSLYVLTLCTSLL